MVPASLFWQETDEWCWAASGEMMMSYAGPRNVPQCYQANQRFGRTDCCNCPTPIACAQPGWPQFDAWGYNFKETPSDTALGWTQLTGEINAERPIWFAWGWNGGGGHALVARGYEEINILFFQEKLVFVDNPWPWQGRCGAGNTSGPFGGDSLEIDSYGDFVGGPGYDHVTWSNIYQVAHK
jgi:hypothetical protein